jgi:hypothetical protein
MRVSVRVTWDRHALAHLSCACVYIRAGLLGISLRCHQLLLLLLLVKLNQKY